MSGDARGRILASVRRALGTESRAADAEEALRGRLASPPRGNIPARSDGDLEKRLALFEEMAREVAATVERLPGMEAVPTAIARDLKEHNLPSKLMRAPDPRLEEPGGAREPPGWWRP